MNGPSRFRLFGPVRGWRDGHELRLGSPQQRLVLTRLLIDEGRPVSIDQLVTTLWRDDPPPAARSTVRTYLSRLRSALGAGVIGSREQWYSVRVGEVDAWRFAALLRDAAAAPDHDRELRLLDEALGLCQDTPLSGLPGEWARAQRVRLEEERDRAVERRARIGLDHGRAAEAVAPLKRLCADHPLRERPHRLLMLALYRDGNRAEALAVHDALRHRLAERLGLDPGDETAELHRRILRADPDLSAPTGRVEPSGTGSAPSGCPGQLLADIPDFTGRDDVVKELTTLLTREHRTAPVVVITGIGGTGKTTLATHVGHRVAAVYGDGQLHVDLRGADEVPVSPLTAQQAMLRSLGVNAEDVPANPDECAALYRSTVSGKRLLIVLDNARDAAQVSPLLPGSSGAATLVTARSMPGGPAGATHTRLDALEPPEAVELLRCVVGADRTRAERAAALDVVTACGCLPLAVRIAAARLAARPNWTIARFAERLRDERRRLRELRVGDLDVEAAFELSYRQLDEDHARAFRRLAVPDAPHLALPAAAAVLDRDLAETEHLTEDLVDLNLLESPDYWRYRHHDLVKLFARTKTPRPEAEDSLRRLIDHYVATAYNGRKDVESGDHVLDGVLATESSGTRFESGRAVQDWLDAEHQGLFLTIHQVARDLPASVRHAGDLLRILTNVHFTTGSRRGEASAAAEAVAVAAAAHGDRFTEGRARWHRAQSLMFEARFAEARDMARTAADCAHEAGDRYGYADAVGALGVITLYADDDPATGAELLLAACLAFQSLSAWVEAAELRSERARMLLMLGRESEALADAAEAVSRLRELGIGNNLADGLYQFGVVSQTVGRLDEAASAFTEALALQRERRLHLQAGRSLYRLAETHLLREETEAASRYADEATATFADIGDEWGRFRTRALLGRIMLATGEPGRARELVDEAVAGLERLGLDSEAAAARAILDEQSSLVPPHRLPSVACGRQQATAWGSGTSSRRSPRRMFRWVRRNAGPGSTP